MKEDNLKVELYDIPICGKVWEDGSSGQCVMKGKHDVCDDARGARWSYPVGVDGTPGKASSIKDDPCYGAVKPGWPGFVAIMMDETDKEGRKWVAREMGHWVKRGWTVERTTRDKAVDGLRAYDAERTRREALPKPDPITELPLFGALA